MIEARRALIAAATVAWFAGCGEPPVGAAAEVHLHAALVAETERLEIWVLDGVRTDGVVLTCETLVLDEEEFHLPVTDERVVKLGHLTVEVDEGGALLSEVAAGSARVVYVQAYDGADALLGQGCVDQVTVPSNDTVTVQVDVYPPRAP